MALANLGVDLRAPLWVAAQERCCEKFQRLAGPLLDYREVDRVHEGFYMSVIGGSEDPPMSIESLKNTLALLHSENPDDDDATLRAELLKLAALCQLYGFDFEDGRPTGEQFAPPPTLGD